MTTIDEKSQAEQDAIAEAIVPGAPVLECVNCGRNCRHVPTTSGSGTAGGIKGAAWTPTDRSMMRCPNCGLKLHRKEGRVHQMVMCAWGQVCMKMGLTQIVAPTLETVAAFADMMKAGEIKPAPTEKQINRILGGMDPAEAMKPDDPKAPAPRKTSLVASTKIGTELVENAALETIPGIPMPTIELPKEPEAKAEAETKPTGLKKKQDKAERKETKKERKARLMEAAEREAKLAAQAEQDDAAQIERNEAAADSPTDEDDGYDPFAGVGQPFADDEDEEELTPAQKAALGV